MTIRLLLHLCMLVALLLCSSGAAEPQRPATRPATYRLVRQTVAGLEPMQWVFVVVTPEGYVYVAAPAKLRWAIEQAVPKGATLNWYPSGKRIDGDLPLDTEAEFAELKAFCNGRGVILVRVAH